MNQIDQNELACRMERNFIAGFKILSGIKDARLEDNDFTTEFISGYQTDWMNSVMRTNGSVEKLNERVASTLEKYKGLVRWRLGPLTKQPQQVKDALTANGLSFVGREPGMVLNRARFTTCDLPADFAVKRVDKPEMVEDYLIPFGDAYGLASDVVEHFRLFMKKQLEQSSFPGAWFVGYFQGEPVSTAHYFHDSDVTLIYGVGTLAEHRKRGYARVTLEAAIKHAWQHSDSPIGLYASAMGHALYLKMGFEDIVFIDEYRYAPPLAT